VVGLNNGSSGGDVRNFPVCPCDGKPCDGVWVLGAPACFTDSFGAVKGKGKTCPRLKGKMRFLER
jgi:hypothetical protein